jgi:hypothetical protein
VIKVISLWTVSSIGTSPRDWLSRIRCVIGLDLKCTSLPPHLPRSSSWWFLSLWPLSLSRRNLWVYRCNAVLEAIDRALESFNSLIEDSDFLLRLTRLVILFMALRIVFGQILSAISLCSHLWFSSQR